MICKDFDIKPCFACSYPLHYPSGYAQYHCRILHYMRLLDGCVSDNHIRSVLSAHIQASKHPERDEDILYPQHLRLVVKERCPIHLIAIEKMMIPQ